MTSRIYKTEDVIAGAVLALFIIILLACSAAIGVQRDQIGDLNERVRVLESKTEGK